VNIPLPVLNSSESDSPRFDQESVLIFYQLCGQSTKVVSNPSMVVPLIFGVSGSVGLSDEKFCCESYA
jgi:hypothetical protein